jgi:hypothetical protein
MAVAGLYQQHVEKNICVVVENIIVGGIGGVNQKMREQRRGGGGGGGGALASQAGPQVLPRVIPTTFSCYDLHVGICICIPIIMGNLVGNLEVLRGPMASVLFSLTRTGGM